MPIQQVACPRGQRVKCRKITTKKKSLGQQIPLFLHYSSFFVHTKFQGPSLKMDVRKGLHTTSPPLGWPSSYKTRFSKSENKGSKAPTRHIRISELFTRGEPFWWAASYRGEYAVSTPPIIDHIFSWKVDWQSSFLHQIQNGWCLHFSLLFSAFSASEIFMESDVSRLLLVRTCLMKVRRSVYEEHVTVGPIQTTDERVDYHT